MRRALRLAVAATIVAVSASFLLTAGPADVFACTGHFGTPGGVWCGEP